jgi:2-oxoisovalerate ferredoxin oxidoreductase beta subunit
MSAVESQRWIREVMEKTYPLGVVCDRTKDREPRIAANPAPGLEEIPAILGIVHDDHLDIPVMQHEANHVDLHVRVAGFGGQGVLLLGEVLAEAGLDAGLEVSWLPSYGPEMRSGTSNCHVRVSREPIDSPLVTVPNFLVAMNEPSLRKFDRSVKPGGWVIYNGDTFPEDCERDDIQVLALNFTRAADGLGDPRAANMVMLGALLEISGGLPQASIDAALRRMVKSERWYQLDERALARGRELYRESRKEVAV